MQHVKASPLDPFVSVENEDFDTQLFLSIRSPAAPILIEISAEQQSRYTHVTTGQITNCASIIVNI